MAVISTTVYSNSLIHSSASFILLLIPSRYVFQFSYCILPLCLVVIFYNYLKLCNFSASVLSHILGSSLWSLLRIHSWVDCWSPHQLSCISEVLSCSLVRNIFLCHLILSKLLRFFLCIWKVSCVSQTWRSGALQGLSYTFQQYTLLASPRGQRLAGAFPLGGGPGSWLSGRQGHVMGYVYRWLWVQELFREPVCLYRWPCSCSVGWLAWGFPFLEPMGYSVGPGLGTNKPICQALGFSCGWT